MLLNHFYTLIKQESLAGKVNATLSFNKDHAIFRGHFPGHPVVPGVCMLQILREIMEVETAAKLRITSGENMKFLAIINPEVNTEVQAAISYNSNSELLQINASLFADKVTFFKFKGTFRKA